MSTQGRLPGETAADMWERLVSAGIPKEAATARVRAAMQPAAAPQAATIAENGAQAPLHPLNISSPESGIRRAARAAAGPFADEISGAMAALVPGGLNYEQSAALTRERAERAKAEHPVLSTAIEFGAALALPGAAAVRGPMAAVGATAATGAAYGAAGGEGAAERLTGAGVGGLFGAALGSIAHIPWAVVAPKTGAVIAQKFGKATGIGVKGETGILAAARKEVDRVRRELYRPLEEAFQVVDDAEITALLSRPEMKAHAEAINTELAERAPSFKELQRLRDRLFNKDRDLGAQLSETMERRIPGFSEANTAYRAARASREAFKEGYQSATKPAELIRDAAATLKDDAAREAFRHGLATREFQSFAKTGKLTRDVYEKWQGMGVAPKLREMFDSTESYVKFLNELSRDGTAQIAKERLTRLAPWAAAAAGFAGGQRLFDAISN